MIISIIANIFVGIIFPILLFANIYNGTTNCFAESGSKEKALIGSIKQYLSVILNIGKIIPAVIAVTTFGAAAAVLGNAATAASACASPNDELTRLVFSIMDSNFKSCTSSLQTQVATDSFSVLLAAVIAIYKLCCHRESPETQVVTVSTELTPLTVHKNDDESMLIKDPK